jgi:DNA-binding CsgD family transcriptional regulator
MESSERYRAMMVAMDLLDRGVCVTDGQGRMLFENAVLRRELSGGSARALDEAMCDLRQAVLARMLGHGEERRPDARLSVQVRTDTAQYEVQAIALAEAIPGLSLTVVMTVRARRPHRMTPDALRAAHGLTARETRIATLLGGGARTREIAESLGISVHTARRHVESVLKKLGVHSRSEVRERLNERVGEGSD